MKRIMMAALCVLLLLTVVAGCGEKTQPGGKLRIVATVFPVYDWVRQIVGEGSEQVELTLLLDNGTDLHSYQPTVDDMVEIARADVFIYVGGPSDDWVTNALKTSDKPDRIVINLLDVLGDEVKEEELAEGMTPEDGEGAEYDEHVWLSLRNAALFCGYIAGKLGEVDPDRAGVYQANADGYMQKLNELDARYRAAVEASSVKTLLFADRFPFRYLVDDYGLTYYAAFAGCSAETEASFETVVFLAEKADELGLRCIMQTESADGSLADTIRRNTAAKDQKVLVLNSLQSGQGETYLSVMESNLAVLREALQ
ncbi:MAG: zinc ABC transporter substrate-binding protein [Oscillospiraceae bacterium]|nr:zinc ABC transporter substrate-binding protein [Oscillospiraceae bacterium]